MNSFSTHIIVLCAPRSLFKSNHFNKYFHTFVQQCPTNSPTFPIKNGYSKTLLKNRFSEGSGYFSFLFFYFFSSILIFLKTLPQVSNTIYLICDLRHELRQFDRTIPYSTVSHLCGLKLSKHSTNTQTDTQKQEKKREQHKTDRQTLSFFFSFNAVKRRSDWTRHTLLTVCVTISFLAICSILSIMVATI